MNDNAVFPSRNPHTAAASAETFAALFARSAADHPDAIALQHGARTLSYRELDDQANRLAHYLRELGIDRETPVGLCLDRSPEQIIAMLAIFKAGGAYLPLDPDYPRERLAYILNDAMPAALLTRAALTEQLPVHWARVVELDTEQPMWQAQPEQALPLLDSPDQLAYLIYTSGSTGQPKGVAVTHRGIGALARAQSRRFDISPGARVLQFASSSFDAAFSEVAMTLLSGACLVTAPAAELTPGAALADLLARQKISHLTMPPSALALMPDGGIPPHCGLIVAGEACPAAQVRRWSAGRTMLNAYGPTEATVCATMSGQMRDDEPADIGAPLPGVQVYVLDDALRPLPPGVEGELYLAGGGLARGYLGRPALSAERFVANPFGPAGSRLYRSGDLARLRADGSLDYLGRTDEQLKLRGYRIEPGEIEHLLTQQAGVSQAVVRLREDLPGIKQLVAYVVSRAGLQADGAALRAALAELLPDYMVPAAVVPLERLPLTPNGKVDKQALPAPDFDDADAGEARNWLEKTLAKLYVEVLGVSRAGLGQGFFDLGGDSISAILLVSRARAHGLQFSPQDVFDHPSIERLALRVRPVEPDAAAGELPPVSAADLESIRARYPAVSAVLPLSPLQRGLLFHLLYDEGQSDVYLIQMGFQLDGPLEADKLRAAAEGLLQRHHHLRAAFSADGLEQPAQIVLERVETPWRELDLSAYQADEQLRVLERLRADDYAAGVDPAQAPLLRFTLTKLDAERHQLLWSFHHLLFDGWSVPVLLRELFALYRGDELPPAIPYRDYLAWLHVRGRDAAKRQWINHLAELEQPTRLAPSAQKSRQLPRNHNVTADPAVYAMLERLARRQGLTLNTLLQAAWAILLARLTSADDVVFGVTVSGRPPELPGVERMVGLLINTVPLRLRLQPEETLTALLQRLQAQQAALIEHQHLSLAEIQQAAGLGDLFDTLLVFENYPIADDDRRVDDALSIGYLGGQGVDTSHYPLSLCAVPGPALELRFGYRPDLFSADAVDSIARQLLELLRLIAEQPELPLSRLQPATPAQQDALAAWNRTDAPLPAATLTQLLERQAELSPDAEALRFDDIALSYRQLHQRANRLARRLRADGVGPETLVAVALPRSVDLVVALLAVLKAGGAYLPLDLDYPAERLAFMLADAQPAVVLSRSELLAGLPVERALCLDLIDDALETLSDAPLDLHDDDRHPAYVIYTSGSTGRPKGAVNSHRAIVNRLLWMQHAYPLADDDVVLQKTPSSFDVSVWEFFWPLLAGASLLLARPDGHRDPAYLAELIRRRGVTTLHFVPSMLDAFLLEPASAGCASLRRVLCSGEALPAPLLARAAQTLPCPLHNLYGPTEAAVDVTAWTCDPARDSRSVPIGRPIWNTQLFVLDSMLRPLPPGIPGELYLGGVGLARGYLRRPALTAERFVAHPFAVGQQLYRTGDRVVRREDGALEYLGRLDHQVKLRGLRIELGEIEAALLDQPGVAQAVALIREDAPGQRRLVAYVVPAAGIESDVARWRDAMAARLPDYMVPAAWVALDALPLTPNGKLDRRALPAPELTLAEHREPVTEKEKLLAEAFAQTLGLERVGLDDSFFNLGGDSISSIQLVSLARKRGLSLTPRQVFEQRSVRGLALVATEASAPAAEARADAPLLRLEPAEIERLSRRHPGLAELLPLTPLQQGLLFHALYDHSAANPYVVQMRIELDGALDAAALRRAGEGLLRRHPHLLASFIHHDTLQPMQALSLDGAAPWREADLSALSRDDARARLEDIQTADHGESMPPDRGPLLRFTLIRLAPERHLLLWTFHHLLLDGWSLPVLLEELFALYRQGEAAALPPAPAYRDYLRWLSGRDRDAARQAWSEYLRGVDEPTLVAPGLPAAERRPDLHTAALSTELSAALAAQARRRGLTLNTLAQAAWGLLLARLTGRDDLLFGITVSGRTAPLEDIERLPGLLINTVPLRLKLEPSTTLAGFLDDLQSRQAAMMEHQHLGLGDIRQLTDMEELFDTLMVFENYPQLDALRQSRAGDGLSVRPVEGLGGDVSHYPLGLCVVPGERLELRLGCRADAFPPTAAERLLASLSRLFQALAGDLELPLASLRWLDETESRQQDGWNATARATPSATLPELFRRQAELTPDAVAVCAGDLRLSYRQLDRQSNALAHRLRAAGVTVETPVALWLQRGPLLPVAILGVLKAGGCYIPLHTAQPEERRAWTLTQSRAALLLADEAPAPAMLPPGLPVLRIDGPSDSAERPPRLELTPDALAYVMYTSGSTGVPKGIAISHANVRDLALDRRWEGASQSKVLLHSPHAFDAATYELWAPLLHGGQATLAPPWDNDIDSLADVLQRESVSAAFLTTALFNLLAEERPDCFASLRTLWTGGESASLRAFQRVRERYPQLELVHVYGPTETTTFATCYPLPRDQTLAASLPIGAPMDNTRAYVLDSALRPLPAGAPGELYLAGSGLARGYLNQPALSAERFVANPFGPAGSRLYRSGDRARWRADGQLEFLGRADQQIKLRGFRIELGEIEARLREHPAVSQARAVLRETDGAPRQLLAYVALHPGADIDPSTLRQALAAQLPDYMVPAAVVALNALPLTPNGKLDHRALPAPELQAGGDRRPPRSDAERILAGLYAELLGLDEVGLDDGFFDLGGDSIASILLVSRARRQGLLLSPREVFLHPRVEALAAVARPVAAIAAEDTAEGPLPATPIIRWWLERGGPQGGFYQSMLLQTPAGLEQAHLAKALQALLDKHDALRMRLDADGGLSVPPVGSTSAQDCLRRIAADAHLEIPPADIAAAARQLDPAAGAMLRALWLDAGPDAPGRLWLGIHHLAVDGVSWRILLPDLASAWRDVQAGRPIQLDPVATSFRRWALLLNEDAVRAARAAETPMWAAIQSQPDPLLSPCPLDPALDTAGTSRRLSVGLPAAVTTELLTRVPALFHAGINDVLLTGFALAVARWRQDQGRSDGTVVRLELEGHGREELGEHCDLSRTVGWFTSLFPVCLDPGVSAAAALDDAAVLGDALKRVKEQLRALPDRGLGYGLLRYLNPETAARLSGAPPAQLGFNYLGRFATPARGDWMPAPEAAGLDGNSDPSVPQSHAIELNAATHDGPDGPELVATWLWAGRLFDRQEIERLAEDWFDALRALARLGHAPDVGGSTPSDHPLAGGLSQEEIDLIEAGF
ncbi:non-ribosomal peptide synthetase [Chromobacterium haemolyticum]|nr:non-ribosomal peptide synthetase [Chromobacterium haemolyticum]BBH13306.1 non-ribosomal peptide synthetase [Chromobacterium haemolyticum]